MADAGEAHRMTMNNVEERVRQLTMLRNVGEKTALALLDLGIETPEQMFEADPETLFEEMKHRRGGKLDRCVLYLFRGAKHGIAWPECKDPLTPPGGPV
ncbi:MAG: TfoX/Sxy family DNA transformation protein [Chloroflexi bacterium]|nr:TfoX/Sxy family DNA transformation protein [Chloroflexota bacterium]